MAGPRTARAEDKRAGGRKDPPMPPAPETGTGLVPRTRDQEMPNFSSLIAAKSLTSPPTRLVA
jgi:hypothetical protein